MLKNRLTQLIGVINNTICTQDEEIIGVDEGIKFSQELFQKCHENGGIIYVVGNGGSAGIASHFCNDLVKALQLASSTLVDSNLLTCMANDYGYEHSYSGSLKVLMKENDLLVAISSSGNSLNIINSVNVAQEKKAKVITLSGFKSINPLRKMGNINFWLNVSDYGLVETGHFFLLHTMVDLYNAYFSQKNSVAHAGKN
ncbi:MAG: SIS domain-containing protein [Chlamydiae bacterium]|nr:SIS domain-containing protein [Chlamydiota bacterium]